MNSPCSQAAPTRRPCPARLLALALCALLSPGCAAITNPLVDSIPVRHAPPELIQNVVRDKEQSIPLSYLQQPPSDAYRLDAGDVLGVWIENIIGEKTVPIPVHTLANPSIREQRNMPPSAGYPFTVREDGTLLLPLLQPLPVRGMTLSETSNAVADAYVKSGQLREKTVKSFVTLLQKRQYEIVVLRQEATAFGVGPEGGFSTAGKRGFGAVINLAAYENDVMHALALTGGLPGLDAYNQVVIYRHLASNIADRQMLLRRMEQLPPGAPLPPDLAAMCGPIIRIPLRQDPHLPLPFTPQDMVLETGDVIYLEARDRDVYYSGGLLPAGEHVLPRDRDLDVLAAVALVRGPMVNSTFGSNTLSGQVFPPGLGQPSASLLVVLRKTADGNQVPIRVDLNRALRDSRERIVLRAGDLLILQERPTEALARYMGQSLANFNLIWSPIHGPHESGIFDIMAPDRIPGRGQYSTFVPGQGR